MAKRFTDSEKWKDDWYLNLDNDSRIVWQYLLDNCSIAGIIKLSLKHLNFCCNTNLSTESLEDIFEDRLIDLGDFYFIPKFISFQYPSGINSNKPAIVGVRKELAKYGLLDNDYNVILNNKIIITNDCSIIKDKDMDKDKVKDKNKDQDQPKNRGPLDKSKDLYDKICSIKSVNGLADGFEYDQITQLNLMNLCNHVGVGFDKCVRAAEQLAWCDWDKKTDYGFNWLFNNHNSVDNVKRWSQRTADPPIDTGDYNSLPEKKTNFAQD